LERINRADNIIFIDSDDNIKLPLEKARKVLLSGGIVAFPTESFYGLAVDIENEKAIEKLFTLKQRDKDNPILILLPELEALNKYAEDIPDQAVKLIEAFWPGGLTMLFKASQKISPLLTANTGKIGIRYSGHTVATALARSIGYPVTGTSANISEQPPCVKAEEVYNYFGPDIDLILDNGSTDGGAGSTIIDVTVSPCVVIREGMVLNKDIEKIVGCKLGG
jgi:L-threonylcarbamoyladenylate synthase